MYTRAELEAALTRANEYIERLCEQQVREGFHQRNAVISRFKQFLVHGGGYDLAWAAERLAANEAVMTLAVTARDQIAAQLDAFDAGRLDAKNHQ